jgi:hypothetical protein
MNTGDRGPLAFDPGSLAVIVALSDSEIDGLLMAEEAGNPRGCI